MDPVLMIVRLRAHDDDHKAHKDAVQKWLLDAGIHPLINPCRVNLTMDSIGVWCGNFTRHATRAIEIDADAMSARARLVSYGGQRMYASGQGATPIEALRALIATGKVPAAMLTEAR